MIESSQNPEVKRLLKLRRARVRRRERLFLVEGQREIEVAFEAEAIFDRVFYCPAFFGESGPGELMERLRSQAVSLVEMAKAPFEKVALRKNPDGLLALCPTWESCLEDLTLPPTPLVLVVDGVEKPGNFGAIIRSAEAFGVDALLCVDPNLDLFNPNAVRSSQGLLFRQPVFPCDRDTAITFLRRHEFLICATSAKSEQSFWELDFRGPSALVMGNEASGLDSFWLDAANHRMTIPMKGVASSLNLSVAAGCLLAEVSRQRLEHR